MEILDIVDENDNVVGTATRSDIYQNYLCHRIIHVLVFNDEGKMVLQKRSSNLSFCPNHWSTAAGGHVGAGESYEEAALREYQEELGATSALEFMGKNFFQTDSTNEFFAVFKTQFNGPFNLNPDEVSEITAFDIDEIKTMIQNGEKFHPELIFIINNYF